MKIGFNKPTNIVVGVFGVLGVGNSVAFMWTESRACLWVAVLSTLLLTAVVARSFHNAYKPRK